MSGFLSAGILGANAIPDSVTSRPDDDSNSDLDNSRGLAFASDFDFDAIAARLSSNTSGVTRARLFDYNIGEYIETLDVSGLTGGDAFAFSSPIVSNREYGIELDGEGSTYTNGFRGQETDYPYAGNELNIISASIDGSQSTSDGVQTVNDIGNPDNILG